MNRHIFFWVVCFVVIGSFLYMHEMTHAIILYYDGCDDYKVGFFSEGSLVYLEPGDDCEMSETGRLGHIINEIVGYNIMPFLALFAVLFLNKLHFDGENDNDKIK